MKKMMDHIWKIVLILIISGIFLMIFGFSLGIKNGMYMDITGVHIINDTQYRITELDLEDFTNLDINVGYADVEFIKSDKYGIDICYYDGDDTINWILENETLKVEYVKQSKIRFFNYDFTFLSRELTGSYVKVYIPSVIELSNVVVKIGSGNINIDDLKAENIKIDDSYGKIAMNNIIATDMQINAKSGNFVGENIIADKTVINSNYGKVNFKNITSKNLHITAESGDCTVTDCTTEYINIKSDYGKITGNNLVSEKTNIYASSGNIKIDGNFLGETILYSKYGEINLDTSKEKEYYSCNISTDYGKIVIDNEKSKDKLFYSSNNNEGNILKITARSGNVHVNFKKYQ